MQFHGNIFSINSNGTNELIKQGAIPVTKIEDFFELKSYSQLSLF